MLFKEPVSALVFELLYLMSLFTSQAHMAKIQLSVQITVQILENQERL